MLNPDTPLRTAYVELGNTIVPTFEAGIPKFITPIPETYILITNQTKTQTEVCKDGNEWLCTVTIDINQVRQLGFYGSEDVDQIEQQIMTIIENDLLVVAGFIVKSADLILSQPLVASDSTKTITRKVLTYQHWLNNVD